MKENELFEMMEKLRDPIIKKMNKQTEEKNWSNVRYYLNILDEIEDLFKQLRGLVVDYQKP